MNNNNNENNFTKEISEIKDELQKSLKNIENIKELYEKENEEIYDDSNYEEIKPKNKQKPKRHVLHITYFIPVLQFLDIKTLIELSKVNHLFYSFIYSFYFYRATNQILIHSNKNLHTKKNDLFNTKKINHINKNDKNKINNSNISNEENIILGTTKKIYSSFMTGITGALSYIAPIPEIPNLHKEKNELEDIEKKINLHEKLLDERIKQLAISNEIKATRAEIDKIIKVQYNYKKNHKKNELSKSINKEINDQTIKKLKREKYESEYKALMKEISEYEKEYHHLKKENEVQNKVGIDLETKINKIKYYAKNTFKEK